MAPGKFGLFKARSRDYQEQPSTENLLLHSNSVDTMDPPAPGSPVPSTSRQMSPEEVARLEVESILRIQCQDDDEDDEEKEEKPNPTRRTSATSIADSQLYSQILYHQFKNEPSCSSQFDQDYLQALQLHEDINEGLYNIDLDDGASTSCDANSIMFDDVTSMAPSEDISIHCGALKKQKKSRSKEEQQMRDFDMWQASNVEVMENLLSRSGTLDEQIKWEAIATSRGLCTLTDNCGCNDCHRAKYLAEVTDGDGGPGEKGGTPGEPLNIEDNKDFTSDDHSNHDSVVTLNSPIPSTEDLTTEVAVQPLVQLSDEQHEDKTDQITASIPISVLNEEEIQKASLAFIKIQDGDPPCPFTEDPFQIQVKEGVKTDKKIEFNESTISSDDKFLLADGSSFAGSHDVLLPGRDLKREKKIRSKRERSLRDYNMWKASNVQVMENLLNRNVRVDDKLKWEVIAKARGLCTLKDSCECLDCYTMKYSGEDKNNAVLPRFPVPNDDKSSDHPVLIEMKTFSIQCPGDDDDELYYLTLSNYFGNESSNFDQPSNPELPGQNQDDITASILPVTTELSDGASTSNDTNSLTMENSELAEKLDSLSLSAFEDISLRFGPFRKSKKSRLREERLRKDFDMWRASNVEVMENLLNGCGTSDEKMKWEAIATARGLCTLTVGCECTDCQATKFTEEEHMDEDEVDTPDSARVSIFMKTPNKLDQIEMDTFRILYGVENDEDGREKLMPTRRPNPCINEDSQLNSNILYNQFNNDHTSSSPTPEGSLRKSPAHPLEDLSHIMNAGLDDASTSCDMNSVIFDGFSLAGSEDILITRESTAEEKKRMREEELMKNMEMWQASDLVVMQNLLDGSGTLDELLKWQVIATSRGLCTLTEGCKCPDCYQEELSDEDEVSIPGSPMGAAILSSPKKLGQMEISGFMTLCGSIGDQDEKEESMPTKRQITPVNEDSHLNSKILYHQFKNEPSCSSQVFELKCLPDKSLNTASCDNSVIYDSFSLAGSEDILLDRDSLKRQKRRNKEEQLMKDIDMWQASNVEVMENLLNGTGTLDEKIKWEAIATSRGLCTLTDNCRCKDCRRAKYLDDMIEDDDGVPTSSLLNGINSGCCLQ